MSILKKTVPVLLLAALLISGCAPAGQRPEGEGKTWTLGYAAEEIVPDDLLESDYYIAGYKAGYPIDQMLDAPHVKALWLDDNTGLGGVAVAVVDCIGLSNADIVKIREGLADFVARTGCRDIHVISTHTHAGIDTLGLWGPFGSTGRSESYDALVKTQAIAAVEKAYENKKDGRIFYGSADTGELQRDSRPPYVYDKNIYSLRFVPADKSAGVRIVNYAAHAESLRDVLNALSADYPAYIAERIKAETGDETVYVPGALGGLIMTHRLKDEHGVEYPVEENVVRTGHLLADLLLGIENERELAPRLASLREKIVIKLENDVFAAAIAAGIITHAARAGDSPTGLELESEVGYLALGDLSILLVPGEYFPELVTGEYAGEGLAASPEEENPKPIKEIAGDREFLIIGLANDEIGYIVPPNDFFVHPMAGYAVQAKDQYSRKHYEETNSMGKGTAGLIADAAQTLFDRAAAGEKK